ncbi:Mitochondrial inner membrane translocase complex subunit Tim44 [Penicillium crustosum]|uniref:Mitochondrial inner membrane translocase complex subunit Tim44 n=1 Tax=Penicillium crustosum TaxID=36656 RepID=UPI00239D2941|nr:Mitochondrial inner membrane translocase complex subunit Tim44 [Penicillium crustosum]KAJ5419605.1 Mitochondrial inner membrane translocase complex subunit Tim44 [Penicillium crustosum]
MREHDSGQHVRGTSRFLAVPGTVPPSIISAVVSRRIIFNRRSSNIHSLSQEPQSRPSIPFPPHLSTCLTIRCSPFDAVFPRRNLPLATTAEATGRQAGRRRKVRTTGRGVQEGEKEKEEEKVPPPPHGDKSPWQVFRETLQSEFKASKEWEESTKALASSAHQFTENENVRRARAAYEAASTATSSKTSTAFKTTGQVIGKGAAWTWNTSVVKGVRKGVNATGEGLEKATRPVRETEAYKSVKNAIDDGSSSRYGGWVEKEERRKQRQLREEQELKAGKSLRVEERVEDPNAARSISDRVAGFFAENETAMVIKKFREIDPNFQMEPFLREMRDYMLPEVLDAYVKGDVETLKLWLSDAQFHVYAALAKQYTTAGLKSDGRILDIRGVDISHARILDPGDIPVFVVTCRTQEIHVYRKIKTGELAAGTDDKVQLVTYAIGLTRIPDEVNNPETRGWRLIELQKAARDYI